MGSATAYSHLKATRHLDIVHAVREGRPARPAHVQLVLSDMCNQACGFCAYRDPAYSSSQRFYEIRTGAGGLRRDAAHPERDYNPRRLMPVEKALEIVDDCAAMGVSAIQFTGGGEPTVHPDFKRVLRRAQGLGLATALVTNGVLLGRVGLEELGKLAWIRISLDAAFEATYSRIRRVPGTHFAAACRAVRAARQSGCPVVGVSFVVTPENWTEVEAAAELARLLGADNLRIAAQVSADPTLHLEYEERAALLCRRAELLAGPGFTVHNRFAERARQDYLEDPLCGYQSFTTYVGADLRVYRCCVLAYNERGEVGSLEGRRFADLWMSQARADEMARFDARGCASCSFAAINRGLAYMLPPAAPAHAEFV